MQSLPMQSLDRDYVGRLRSAPVDMGVYETSPAPKIERVEINGGDAQRSSLNQLSIFFDQEIQIASGLDLPFSVVHEPTGASVDVSVALQTNAGKTTAVLTLLSMSSAQSGDAMLNGNYRLTLQSDKISSGVTNLDGDVDGQDLGQFRRRFMQSLSSPQ